MLSSCLPYLNKSCSSTKDILIKLIIVMLAHIAKQSQLILTLGVVLTNIHCKIKPVILYHDNKISLCIKTIIIRKPFSKKALGVKLLKLNQNNFKMKL